MWLQKTLGQKFFFPLLSFGAVVGSGIRDPGPKMNKNQDKHLETATLLFYSARAWSSAGATAILGSWGGAGAKAPPPPPTWRSSTVAESFRSNAERNSPWRSPSLAWCGPGAKATTTV